MTTVVTVVPGVDRSPLRVHIGGRPRGSGVIDITRRCAGRRTATPLSITVGGTPYWGWECNRGATAYARCNRYRNGRRGAERRFGRRASNPAVARVVGGPSTCKHGGSRAVAGVLLEG